MCGVKPGNDGKTYSGIQFQREAWLAMLSANDTLLCEDDRRSGVLLDPAHPLNGIDFVEFRREPAIPPFTRFVLDVTFLKAAACGRRCELSGDRRHSHRRPAASSMSKRWPPIRCMLRVIVDREGDFSPYVLVIDHPTMSIRSATRRDFSFKAACPSEFDCRVQPDCPPPQRDGAGARLSRQGLSEFPPPDGGLHCRTQSGLAGASSRRSRHDRCSNFWRMPPIT